MKTAGMLMWVIGVALFGYAALFFDPSVDAYGLSGRVANLALLQQQELIAMAGAALFLAGIIFHAASDLAEALKPAAPVTTVAASPPTSDILPTAVARDETSDAELMAQHGITTEGGQYVFGQYRYDRLTDAVAYAKRAAEAR